jgi:hypothetical protein
LTFQITSQGDLDFTITSVYIDWGETYTTATLEEIDLAGNTFWSGAQEYPPFSGGLGDWSGSAADRTIPPFSSRTITFTFDHDMPDYSYFILISFDNGCSISLGN